MMTMNRRRLTAASVICVAFAASGEAAAQKPLCKSARSVAGWSVTASLTIAETGDLLVSQWEASRNFDTHFGLRVMYDTSDSPDPKLKIWHNYKSGDFTMRLPDGRSFTVPVSSNFAVTQANTPAEVISYLREAPVRIEYTAAAGNWSKYRTEGLPDAIAAAEEELALLKEKQGAKTCATRQRWWRRFGGE